MLVARALRLTARGPRPVAAMVTARRELGFFSDLQKKVQEEISKNEELQQSLKSLREHDVVKEARDAAAKAADAARAAQAKAAELAKDASAKAEDVKQSVAESKEAQEALKWAQAARDKAEDAAKQANAAGGEEASKPDNAQGESGGANAQQQAGTSWFQQLGSVFGGDKGAQATPERAPGEDDTETTAVVVKPPSMWEQAFNRAQDSPLVGGLLGAFRSVFGVAGNAASGVTDRVFGENENAEALAFLRERDQAFRPDIFVQHLEKVLVPKVIGAYLAADLKVLRAFCRDQAFATLHSNVQARIAQQIFMDRRILDVSEVELVGFRIVNEEPTAVVQFQTQQINCMRDVNGRVTEGAEDDIRAVYYVFALQQQPPEEEANSLEEEFIDTRPSVERWVVTELAIRGAMQTW